jgi:predicted phosphodiesterase
MKLGIISDIHEDHIRLKEALHLLDALGCHEVACLGDIVGFVVPSFGFLEDRNAAESLQLVRNNCKYITAGNHDLYAGRKIPEFPADFNYPADWYELGYMDRKTRAGNKVWLNEEIELDPLISKNDRTFLSQLPEFLVVKDNEINILLSHYLFPDLSGSSIYYYEEFGPVSAHLDFIEKNNCKLGFSGHRHIEGVVFTDRFGKQTKGFGKFQLSDEYQWVVGPCIANGKKENGCLFFDTESMELKAIPLKTPPRVMMTVDYIDPENEE